jgi:hypothetical protein
LNRLEWRRSFPQKWRKSKLRPKVTIAIGVINGSGPNEHILFASDSQTTTGGAKSLDAKKIRVVAFANLQILVAQSGTAELADKAIDIMERKSAGLLVTSEDTVCGVVQEAVREIRSHLQEINKGCITTDDGWKQYFLGENFFNLLFGFYFERKTSHRR